MHITDLIWLKLQLSRIAQLIRAAKCYQITLVIKARWVFFSLGFGWTVKTQALFVFRWVDCLFFVFSKFIKQLDCMLIWTQWPISAQCLWNWRKCSIVWQLRAVLFIHSGINLFCNYVCSLYVRFATVTGMYTKQNTAVYNETCCMVCRNVVKKMVWPLTFKIR